MSTNNYLADINNIKAFFKNDESKVFATINLLKQDFNQLIDLNTNEFEEKADTSIHKVKSALGFLNCNAILSDINAIHSKVKNQEISIEKAHESLKEVLRNFIAISDAVEF